MAGLSDAIIIVEAAEKGGALITADIANSYNKDVFAFPGQAGDPLAEGCNGLIKRNRAGLIESAADLLDSMNWKQEEKAPKSAQIPLVLNLSEDQRVMLTVFSDKKTMHIDELCSSLDQPVSKVSATLLELEFSNLIRSRPGKLYERV